MLDRSRAKLIMASAISGTVSTYLHAKKRIVTEDGGPQITNPLITGLNPNVQSMQYYDTVSIDQTNEFSTVEYYMSRVVGSLIISDQEEDENQGRAQIFKILKGKIQALDESIKRKFATNIIRQSGLGVILTVLGILFLLTLLLVWWAGSTSRVSLNGGVLLMILTAHFRPENIEEAFDDILELDLNRATDGQSSPRPTVIFAGRNIYRMHKAAARDKQQIQLKDSGTGRKLVNLGISGTTHNGVPLLFDEKLASNDAYFVNEEYLTLHILRGANMRIKKLSSPWNMDATGRRVVWEGQLCSWRQYRTHAYLTNT